MDVYLAGGVNANLKPLYQRVYANAGRGGVRQMLIYLAGCYSRPWCITEWYNNELAKGSPQMGGSQMGGSQMDLYLAGVAPWKEEGIYDATIKERSPIILESFYYADDFTEKMIPLFGKFLLDSGAFTLFSDKSKGSGIVWEDYVDRYADFVVRNNVKTFFELDIDKLIGYERVIALRNRLESKAGRPCIPVWHKSRGKAEFEKMCDQYKYVAIGGIVSKEIGLTDYKYLPWFISRAHKSGAKIHGLGFTALSWLPKCHFDSVDSTAWTTGNRFGAVYQFNGHTMAKLSKGEGQRLKDSRAVAVNNFREWVKFQQWAKTHL